MIGRTEKLSSAGGGSGLSLRNLSWEFNGHAVALLPLGLSLLPGQSRLLGCKKEDDMEHVAHILIAAGYILLVMSHFVA